jgi:Pao retrotransposon peptidase
VARVFAPIGWLQPTILLGKCFMQKLSADSLGWDSEVPKELQHDWLKYASNLRLLSEIRIPRWTGYQHKEMEIFGFCDALETAYAAVIYAKTYDDKRCPQISLIAAKSGITRQVDYTEIRAQRCTAPI